ncbi:MAG: TetR/AcrR family transcriptional regulator [Pseudonocardiaceae bacterium]
MTATARRGRPRSFDRDAVLEAATRLFWQHGYEATSIADLTQAMGIAPPSLYATFGDKKTLFAEVVEAYGRRHGTFIWRALEEEPTARAGVGRMLRETAEVYTDPAYPPGCLLISAATNCTRQSADVADMLRRRRNANVAELERRITADIEAGELPADADARALAVFTAAVVQGMSQQACDGATRDDLRAVAEAAMRAWP